MQILMLNFSGLAMTRMEMKKVKGGKCYYHHSGGNSICANLKDCQNFVNNGWGSNYCCSGCDSASWCQNETCP